MILQADIQWPQNGKSARAAFRLDGGITALVGPSGAGKTTVARMLAGLETPSAGSVRIHDRFLFHRKKRVNVPTAKRGIALVSQDAALFPHLAVADNIAFSPSATPESIQSAVTAMGCLALMERLPQSLSGGEKRRVAIARALASKPDLLILDEPMTGLDPKSRDEILPYFNRLSGKDGTPVLLITHQLEDMLSIADNAILMAPEETILEGTLEAVIGDGRCAELLGLTDAGQLLSGTVTDTQNGAMTVDIGGHTLSVAKHGLSIGEDILLRIFASDVALAKAPVKDISIVNQLPGTVVKIEETTSFVRVQVQLSGSPAMIESRITNTSADRLKLQVDSPIVLLIKAVSVKESATLR